MSVLRLAFLDVGQGDTTIIYDPVLKEAVIVDCVDYIAVIDFLLSENIRRVRAIILTHPHRDHFSGIAPFIDNCELSGIMWDAWILRWYRGYKKRPDLFQDPDGHSEMEVIGTLRNGKQRMIGVYQNLLYHAKNSNIRNKIVGPYEMKKDVPILSSIDFLYPKERHFPLFEDSNLNNLSLVIRVSDVSKALLTGDIEPAGWEAFRSSCSEQLQNDVLKFPHHGAWQGGKVSQILDDVKPRLVVISVGTANTYYHPNQAVFTEIRGRSEIRLLCTQATAQCSTRIKEVRGDILKIIKDESKIIASASERGNGCPCAGTVIIELSENVKVLSPSLQLHIKHIIQPYMNNHQCSLH